MNAAAFDMVKRAADNAERGCARWRDVLMRGLASARDTRGRVDASGAPVDLALLDQQDRIAAAFVEFGLFLAATMPAIVEELAAIRRGPAS